MKKSKSMRRHLKTLPQIGTLKSPVADKQLDALLPGRRVSASGKRYTETRRNRSDKAGSKL